MSNQDVLRGLDPAPVWQYFERLSQVPRGSGKEERAVAFVQSCGAELGLEVCTDATGNVVIRKPATPGMELCPTVALQSHVDMVQQQEPGLGFDFDTQAIGLRVDKDWVRAKGTTLGADNGIGVALSLAVLASTDIPHPAIEALFTVDEEVGMSGADAVISEQLTALYLINLDMESDSDLTIGCAGAVDVVAEAGFEMQPLAVPYCLYEISVTGGLGGHSGLDIHLGRANAIKLLAAAINQLAEAAPLTLVAFEGDGVANVIPRRAKAQFAVSPEKKVSLEYAIQALPELLGPHLSNEPDLAFACTPVVNPSAIGFPPAFQKAFLNALIAIKSGVVSMNTDVEGLVETSNNLSVVMAKQGRMTATCLARTCVEAHKVDVIHQIQDSFINTGAAIRIENDSPGWEPRLDSQLLRTMKSAYNDLHGVSPGVIAIHAGLETGILSNTFPNTEMVSYGPNIQGAHSPDERVQISSVAKVWQVLRTTLAAITVTKDQ